ncbi:MAG: cysteine desulfurase [Clostridia bacterium]|nr:cysteine desulfurase [Clostridia bacterium]
MKRIYLDHAATTPLDKEILEKMTPYFLADFGNADSPHAQGRAAMNAVDNARDLLAEKINAKPSEVYFTSGGTEADNWAMYCGAYAAKEKGRNQILVSAIEHHAVLASAERLKNEGFEIVYIPAAKNGKIEVKTLQSLLCERTGLVAVMSANNETGVLQPIEELCAAAKAAGSLFFTDGVQLAPYLPIDVKKSGVDMLSLSAHKFYGPKGCGALYIKGGVKMRGLIVGGEQERGLRGGTSNVPAIVGMAAAYAKNLQEQADAAEKLRGLRALFLQELAGEDGVEINGEEGLPALLNLRLKGIRNTDFVYSMDLKGVSLSAGSACASASIKPSHVLLAMGLSEEEARESVRFSFGKENTKEEILQAANVAKELISRLRGGNSL